MKTKAIIASNIDDYIHGWACICGEGTLRGFKEGMNFMGIKHYKRN